MTTSNDPRIDIRVAADNEIDAAISVCAKALKWSSPTFDEALFRWKHLDNHFGRSLLLVAVEQSGTSSRIVAVRPLMRWRFITPTGNTIEAARAVDTATLPEVQGQGLFRRLTLQGIERLEADGCGFVFNTPNAKSLAGYLKMGWFDAGEISFGMRLRSSRSLPRLAKSRTSADKPSIEVPNLGVEVEPALDALDPNVLTPTFPTPDTLRTAHTLDSLKWRFCGGPVTYRYLPIDGNGGVIVRVRSRGKIRELVSALTVGSPLDSDVASIIGDAMELSNADVCVAEPTLAKTLRIPKLGPTLALRSVTVPVSPGQFAWTPGDIELF